MTKTPTLYKVLNKDGSTCHGGRGRWHLPAGKRPGKWMRPIKNIALCERGYHVVKLQQLPHWIGPAIYEVEVRGRRIDDDNKSVVSEARLIRRIVRWNDRTARLFAADCASRTHIFLNDDPAADVWAMAARAARAAAVAETGAVAGAAAWNAERRWQARRLAQYFDGTRP